MSEVAGGAPEVVLAIRGVLHDHWHDVIRHRPVEIGREPGAVARGDHDVRDADVQLGYG